MTKTHKKGSVGLAKERMARKPQVQAPNEAPEKASPPKNPFVAPHAEEPNLEFMYEFVKRDLPKPIFNRELLVKRGKLPKSAEKPHISEYIISAIWHHEDRQLYRDGLIYFLQKKYPQPPAYGLTHMEQPTMEELLDSANEIYVPHANAITLSDYRTAAKFIYCDRVPPKFDRKDLRRCFRNERQWTMVLSVNRDQPLAAFIREMEKTLIPEFRKQLLQIAMIDIYDAALNQDELARSHEVQGKDFAFRKVLKKIKSADSAKRRGSQEFGQKALQRRLLSLACYRYAQAGYGHMAYNNAIRRLNCYGIYDTILTEKTFTNRVWNVAMVMVREWKQLGDLNLLAEVQAGRIHFPQIIKGKLMKELGH